MELPRAPLARRFGQAALDRLLASRGGYDAVVLDVMLPGRNGFEVVKELRTAGIFVPVLMLHRVVNRAEAMQLANDSNVGLTAGFYGAGLQENTPTWAIAHAASAAALWDISETLVAGA